MDSFLLVGDGTEIRNVAKGFERRNYEVFSSRNKEEALQILWRSKGSFMVVIDQNIPFAVELAYNQEKVSQIFVVCNEGVRGDVDALSDFVASCGVALHILRKPYDAQCILKEKLDLTT